MVTQYRLHQRKSGIYYHRVKVPIDIRQHYGKEIEQVSLGTRDPREAVRRLPAVIVQVDRLFCRLRDDQRQAGLSNMDGMTEAAPISPRVDIKRAAAMYAKEVEAVEVEARSQAFKAATSDLRAFIRSLEIPADHDDYLAHLEMKGDPLPVLGFVHRVRLDFRITAVKRSRSVGDFEVYELAADRLAPAIALLDRSSLIKAMIDAELRALEAWWEAPELVAHPLAKAHPGASVAPSEHAPSAAISTFVADLPLMSVISRECYKAIGNEKSWSAKTEVARHTQIKQFLEICDDKPLNLYTQDHIRDLKKTLRALPPQSHGKKQFKGMTKVQIAAKAQELGMAGLSEESVRQIMTSVSMVFGWARAEHQSSLANIVQPMIPAPSAGGSKRGKRHGFTSQELQRLFSAPVFNAVKSEREWFDLGPIPMQHTGRFWVPLLALYSGARLMEAVQLLRNDVQCDGDIWFLDISLDDDESLIDSEASGKTVKNENSIRRIPVHPELVRLGFLDFVKTIPQGERLFPDIPIGPDTQRHRYASKMFNKLLAVAGIKSPKKVWHSLRHSFEQACRDSRVDSAIMDQLQGHAQANMRGVYGDGYKLPELNQGIISIRYEGLDLSRIHPFRIADGNSLAD